ncbi:MAG: translation initiation factor IF-2 N-terminal domain-containing protein, partial [Planctomycetota bacterium]
MAKTTRVHLLAKELNVKSKAIVEKCQAEGLDQIKNHMSTISVGLAATIREWFSEGAHSTTVEVSGRVDLKKVRIKRKKKVEEPTPEETVEAPIDQPQAESAAIAETAEALETETPETAPIVEAEVAEEPVVAEEKPQKAKKTKKKVKKPAKPKEPEVIIPAGPLLDKPKPAVLAGPTVIRVEKIEEEETRPKPRRAPRPRHDAPMTEPLLAGHDTLGKGKKAGKAKTHGRKKDRGLEERRARLAAARGETKRARPSRRIEARKSGDVMSQTERPEKATISEPILVKDLSAALALKVGEVIGKLMSQGVM